MAKRNSVRTSARVATIASKGLRDSRYSKAAKSAFASALSNRRPKAN